MSDLLQKMGQGQGYLKAGGLGFNKSGKTWTAALLAIGTRKFFDLKGPIAMYDTEGGGEYIAPLIRKHTGEDLVGLRSRSLADLLNMAKECEKDGISALIADSVTHPWREVCSAYLQKINEARVKKGQKPRFKLEFQDWGIIKDLWAPWTEFYLNSKLHIIVLGRAGYDYDYETNEETNRRELVKTGVKMKTEGEFGFEPSLLFEMERAQDLGEEKIQLLHRCTIIGDRFGVIDGSVCDNPTFEFFRPHVEMLKAGAHAPIDMRNKTADGLVGVDSGDAEWHTEKKNRVILCEEIQGLMVEKWPGQTAEEKKQKSALLETIFRTRSWTKVEDLPSHELREGLNTIREMLRPLEIVTVGAPDIPV